MPVWTYKLPLSQFLKLGRCDTLEEFADKLDISSQRPKDIIWAYLCSNPLDPVIEFLGENSGRDDGFVVSVVKESLSLPTYQVQGDSVIVKTFRP